MAKIFIIEDDVPLVGLLSQWLTNEKHVVEYVDNGKEGLEWLRIYECDLVILDINLPGMNGFEVCRLYRDHGGIAPILMLTGRDSLNDKEAGLDLGADDYLTKPFDARELTARVRALLRRPKLHTGGTLRAGNIELNFANRRVTSNGEVVKLQPMEFALLEFLLRHPNQVFSPEALLNHVWQSGSEASADTLRTYIKTLRRKLEAAGAAGAIETVHGSGYLLKKN